MLNLTHMGCTGANREGLITDIRQSAKLPNPPGSSLCDCLREKGGGQPAEISDTNCPEWVQVPQGAACEAAGGIHPGFPVQTRHHPADASGGPYPVCRYSIHPPQVPIPVGGLAPSYLRGEGGGLILMFVWCTQPCECHSPLSDHLVWQPRGPLTVAFTVRGGLARPKFPFCQMPCNYMSLISTRSTSRPILAGLQARPTTL